MTPRTMRTMLVFAAFAAGLLSVLAVIVVVSGRINAPVIATASAVGGPFQLTDHTGKRITNEDLKGRPFLIFFGFTHCPDICPTTLFEMSEVLRRIPPGPNTPRALFVTVDPERDTPDKLKDYLSSFDPQVIGVTGTPSEVAQMLKSYRVFARKVPTEGDGYTMDHTALIYLMDKHGNFVAPFNLKRTPEQAAADLRRYY